MNQDFMDPEIFADFIIEAKEHLETIEPTLLELEKAPDNLSLLNDVFRPMHSLKGASGFLGLNKINGLAHKAENILDELRNGNLVVTTDIMDVILSATDALRNMIDSLDESGTEGNVDTGPIIEQIALLMAGETFQASSAEIQSTEEHMEDSLDTGPIDDPAEDISLNNDVETEDASMDPEGPQDEIDWDALETSEQTVALGDLPDLPPFEPETYKLSVLGEEHLSDFLEEAHENVQSLGTMLIDLEKDPIANKELVNDIFRFFHNLKGNSGTIVSQEDKSMEYVLVSGIAYDKDQARVTVFDVLDQPGVASSIFTPLAQQGVLVDMIIQNTSRDGHTDMTFTVQRADLQKTLDALNTVKDAIGAKEIQYDIGVCKVSVIGVGMRNHSGVASKSFEALRDEGINLLMISTSEIKITMLIEDKYAELAVRTLHEAFELDKAPNERVCEL